MNIHTILKYKTIFFNNLKKELPKIKCKDNKYFKIHKKINLNISEKKKTRYAITYINE